MISEKMQGAFLDQINKELYSEYLYLSMKAYFANLNLMGFVNWMDVQVQKEHAHRFPWKPSGRHVQPLRQSDVSPLPCLQCPA